MKPLCVIPTYVREGRDVEVFQKAISSLRETAGDRCDVMVVDDGSPEPDLVNGLRVLTENFDGEFIAKERNEGYCSPPDEMVLTSTGEEVALAQLDPTKHGLVAYNRPENILVGGAWSPKRKRDGYAFTKVSRRYDGNLVGILTSVGQARVTPNHGVTFQWTEEALAGWCVYVMRRGRDWRLGQTKMTHHMKTFGPWNRRKHEGADDIWILALHGTRAAALKQEALLAWTYGVPTLCFRTLADNGISQTALNEIWAGLKTADAAKTLLRDMGRDPRYPLRALIQGRARRLTTQAANLMPEGMLIPSPGKRHEVRMVPFVVDSERYKGTVISLDVEKFGHYLSGGVIVHNSRTINTGLQRALDEGRDAVTINADIEFNFDCDWLGLMQAQERLDGEGLASVVGARLLFPNGTIQHGGVLFSVLTRTFHHIHQYGPGNLPEALVPRSCPVTGALQFIRHEALEAVGLYDQMFSLSFEDVDFCVRTWLSKRGVVYQPAIVATHHESFFRGRPNLKIARWQAESWHYFAIKWSKTNFGEFVPDMTLGEAA